MVHGKEQSDPSPNLMIRKVLTIFDGTILSCELEIPPIIFKMKTIKTQNKKGEHFDTAKLEISTWITLVLGSRHVMIRV